MTESWARLFERAREFDASVDDVTETLADHRADD